MYFCEQSLKYANPFECCMLCDKKKECDEKHIDENVLEYADEKVFMSAT